MSRVGMTLCALLWPPLSHHRGRLTHSLETWVGGAVLSTFRKTAETSGKALIFSEEKRRFRQVGAPRGTWGPTLSSGWRCSWGTRGPTPSSGGCSWGTRGPTPSSGGCSPEAPRLPDCMCGKSGV